MSTIMISEPEFEDFDAGAASATGVSSATLGLPVRYSNLCGGSKSTRDANDGKFLPTGHKLRYRNDLGGEGRECRVSGIAR